METLELIHDAGARVRPADLPALRPRAAERARRLARPRLALPLVDGLQVSLVSPVRLDWREVGSTVEIAFTVSGEMGYLRTTVPLVQRLLSHADVRIRPDELDAELAAMIVETVLIEQIEGLETRLGGEIALLNLDRSMERAGLAALPFLVTLDGGEGWPGAIFGSTALLSALARQWENRPPIETNLADLTFTLAYRVAFTDLGIGALRALSPGDAMMFDRLAVPGGAAAVVAEAMHATATFDEEGHLFLSEAFMAPERYALGDFLMTDGNDEDRAAQAVADVAIDDLPVRLVFEVGRTEIALSDLRSLAVGAPLPIDRPASSAVQIFANGRRVGAGEMVMIGDQLGVRITQMNGNA